MVAISPGKLWSLRRLSDRNGRFALLALDQRAATADLIAGRRARLLRDARLAPTLDGDLGRLKLLLVEGLSPHASGVLVDPDAYAHVARGLDPARGLILPLEHHAYADGPDGRRTLLYPGWSAAKARRLGADAVKLRLWYRADAGAAVRAHQCALVERVGQECREHDLAFLLEPMLHALGDGACEDPVLRPELLLATLQEFRKERYAIDLLVLETPLPPASIPDPDGSDPACIEAQRWFDRVNALMGWPWVMLSAGATAEEFGRLLTFACRSGASGFLAGGALWWQAAQEFPDWQRLRWRVQQESATHFARALTVLAAYGCAWPEAPPYAGAVEITPTGPGFAERYGSQSE